MGLTSEMSGSVAACITLSTASGTVPRRRVVLAEGRYRRFQSPVALAKFGAPGRQLGPSPSGRSQSDNELDLAQA